MSQETTAKWKSMRTPETEAVETLLRIEFPDTDAYRYNSASIRVRVIDPRFDGKSVEERDAMVEPLLDQLPRSTQADIMNLLTLSPKEAQESFNRRSLLNLEFEDPTPSRL